MKEENKIALILGGTLLIIMGLMVGSTLQQWGAESRIVKSHDFKMCVKCHLGWKELAHD